MREGGVESTDVTTNGGSGSGGGDGRGNGLDATRLVNARASKLVRAEAEAYADVEVSGCYLEFTHSCGSLWTTANGFHEVDTARLSRF